MKKPGAYKDKNAGIRTTHWFWASMGHLGKGLGKGPLPKAKESGAAEEPKAPAAAPAEADAPKAGGPDQVVRQLLTDNPGISGATLLNLIKANGLEIHAGKAGGQVVEPQAAKEADTAGANAQVLRARESSAMQFRAGSITAMRESSASDNGIGPTRFRTVILEQGLGNMKDAFYYERSFLESAVPVFEGKKIYADHPSTIQEETLPERSVRDVLGHFENVAVEQGEDGVARLMGDVVVLADKPYEWARGLMRHAVEYRTKFPDKDFVGISINANGFSGEASTGAFLKESTLPEPIRRKLEMALAEGVETIRVATEIKDAVSADLVTEAGAGGKIIKMIEGEKQMGKKVVGKVKEAEAKQSEAEAKQTEAEGKEAEAKQAEGKQADAPAPGHADEEQDVALIKKMLAEYVGAEESESAETVEAAKQAVGLCKKAGMDAEEAMRCAGYGMKMAKIHASHQADAAKQAEAEKETKQSEAEGKESEAEGHKESAAELKLKGENARLREQLAARELNEHIDTKLRESKLPMAVTKRFRESLKAPRSKAEVDEKFNLFIEGYRQAGGGEAEGLDFIVGMEKGGEPVEGVSFADCATE